MSHYRIRSQQSKMTRRAENDWKRLQIASSVHMNFEAFTVMHHPMDPVVSKIVVVK